ncbi:MAG: GNAT family N-acetyltransferase [Rhodoblastus sp.]
MVPPIRDASPEDSGAIAAIYNHAVRTTTAIWNDRAVDAANRAAWLAERQAAGFAVIVAELDGRIAGYAAYGPFRAFEGYRLTVENSVYVAPGMQGRGVGRALMDALLSRARNAGFHAMVAGIEAENHASIRLHEALGFAEVGRMPQVGAKFGRWLDLVFLQRLLSARAAP